MFSFRLRGGLRAMEQASLGSLGQDRHAFGWYLDLLYSILSSTMYRYMVYDNLYTQKPQALSLLVGNTVGTDVKVS